MTPASSSKFTAARVGAILFSVSLMGGFVWYSHVRAQPQNGVAVGEGTAQATILPGSKRSNVTATSDDLAVLRGDGTIDLNLQADASGKSEEPAKSEKPMILPSSKLGVFRNIASSPSATPETGEGTAAPKMTPPPLERPVMLSGSKSFAGPVISGERIGNVIIIGRDEKTAPQTQAAGPGPSPAKSPGTGAPDPGWNRDAPIFTSSKSGAIFPTVPQVPQRPIQAQTVAPQAPPPAQKMKAEAAPKPRTETSVPASPKP